MNGSKCEAPEFFVDDIKKVNDQDIDAMLLAMKKKLNVMKKILFRSERNIENSEYPIKVRKITTRLEQIILLLTKIKVTESKLDKKIKLLDVYWEAVENLSSEIQYLSQNLKKKIKI